ncbi:MAG: hypothetical protein AAGA77_12695 [Bacteroidota bacterium]
MQEFEKTRTQKQIEINNWKIKYGEEKVIRIPNPCKTCGGLGYIDEGRGNVNEQSYVDCLTPGCYGSSVKVMHKPEMMSFEEFSVSQFKYFEDLVLKEKSIITPRSLIGIYLKT